MSDFQKTADCDRRSIATSPAGTEMTWVCAALDVGEPLFVIAELQDKQRLGWGQTALSDTSVEFSS